MPTNKPRYNLTIDVELLRKINEYQRMHHIDSQNKAIIDLINIGLMSEEDTHSLPIPVLNRDEISVILAIRRASPNDRSKILELASSAMYNDRIKSRISAPPPPKYDAITLLYGYESAGEEAQKQIDAIINSVLTARLLDRQKAARAAASDDYQALSKAIHTIATDSNESPDQEGSA